MLGCTGILWSLRGSWKQFGWKNVQKMLNLTQLKSRKYQQLLESYQEILKKTCWILIIRIIFKSWRKFNFPAWFDPPRWARKHKKVSAAFTLQFHLQICKKRLTFVEEMLNQIQQMLEKCYAKVSISWGFLKLFLTWNNRLKLDFSDTFWRHVGV